MKVSHCTVDERSNSFATDEDRCTIRAIRRCNAVSTSVTQFRGDDASVA